MDVGLNYSRNIPRASAPEAGGDRNVLPSSCRESHGKSLDGGAEPGLPEDLAGVDVHGAEVTVEVADKCDTAGRGKHGGEIGGTLVSGPNLLHGPDVKRGKLSDVAIGAGHLVEAPVARRAA